MNSTVILVAYYADDWLPACVESLASASTQRLHLVLVDNAGNTIIDKLDFSAFDTEILKTPRPMGFAEANNYALTHARYLEDTVLFLNQDTVSHPGWIDQCFACLGSNPEIGALSPLIHTYDGTDWDPSFLACLSDSDIDNLENVDGNEDWIKAEHVPAPSMIIRTDVLLETGPFDPIYGSYFEDYDLCQRVMGLNFAVGFCKIARINHYSGSATTTREKELKRMQQLVRNRVIFKVRVTNKPRWIVAMRFATIDFPRRLLRGLMGTPSSQPPLVVLKAYRDLLGVAQRVFSDKHDTTAWKKYLETINWSKRVNQYIASQTVK